jgi:class 3 adenylate cyclase
MLAATVPDSVRPPCRCSGQRENSETRSYNLEFTLIGDTVNVAARVEQLTKTTGDAILLTDSRIDALALRPLGLIDRGTHALKGKSAAVQVFTVHRTASFAT